MVWEEIFTATSVITLIFSIIILVFSVYYKDRLTAEDAWNRLVEHRDILKTGFFLTSISLSLYLAAESAELLNTLTESETLSALHTIGEAVHMLIALGALLLLLPLFKATLGGRGDA